MLFLKHICGKLGENYCDEHDDAAAELPYGHFLIYQHPCEYNSEHRFKAQQERSDRGVGIALSEGLESERHSAGQNTCVEQIGRCAHYGMDTRLFKDKHENDGNYTRDKELRARELDSVDYSRIFVDNKNMYRKADRTRESEQFALAESRLAARTQQIKSDNAESDAIHTGRLTRFLKKTRLIIGTRSI